MLKKNFNKICCTLFSASALLLSAPAVHSAEQTVMFGLVYTFGGDLGLSAKLLSQREPNTVAGAIGVSWYPLAQDGNTKFGFDVSAVALFERNTAMSIGWDFAAKGLQLGTGYADLKQDKKYRPYIVNGKISALPPGVCSKAGLPTASIAALPAPPKC